MILILLSLMGTQSQTALLVLLTIMLIIALYLIAHIAIKYYKSKQNSTYLSNILDNVSQSIFIVNKDLKLRYMHNVLDDRLLGDDKSGKVSVNASIVPFANNTESPINKVCSELVANIDAILKSGIGSIVSYTIGDIHYETRINKFNDNHVICQAFDVTSTVNQRSEIERKSHNELSVAMLAEKVTSWVFDTRTNALTSAHVNDIIGHYLPMEALLERTHPKYRNLIVSKFQELIDKRSTHIEMTPKVMDIEGKWQWRHVHAIPHEFAPDGTVLSLIGSQKDVTQEVEFNKKVSDNQIKLKMAVKSGGMQQWEYSIAEQMFVISPGDIIAAGNFERDKMLSLMHPEDVPYYNQETSQLISGKVKNIKIDVRLSLHNDQYNWYKFNAAVFEQDENGNPTRIIGLVQDITERVAMTNELIYLRDKAEESNRLKSAFLANMSHEIRTPLNAIVGFSNLLTMTEEEEERVEYSNIIEQNNELLLTLIDDILDLSKIESGKIEFVYTTISVNVLLSQLKQSTQLKAQSGVTVELNSVGCENLEIESDTQRLTQVLANFLNNAAKFTSNGTITLGCEIMEMENKIRFYVKDTGIGISQENLDKVFGRFFKLNTNIPGTGLGLSICETIIRMLGGSLGARSEIGKGSEFWCLLPIKPLKQDASSEFIPEEKEEQKMIIPLSRAKGLNNKILIGEDNPMNYALYEKVLGNDYELIHAWNGVEAIDLFVAESPNIVIMDLSMPQMDGFETTIIIRRQDQYIPIIAVSASIMPQDRYLALSNGFTDFIPKPINSENFKRVIDEYMNPGKDEITDNMA